MMTSLKPIPKPRVSKNGTILSPISPGLPERRSCSEIIADEKLACAEKPTPPPRQASEPKKALIPSVEAIQRRSSELSEKSHRLSSATTDSDTSTSSILKIDDPLGSPTPNHVDEPPTSPPPAPPLPPRKTPGKTEAISFESVPKSPFEQEGSFEILGGGIDNPLYVSRRETEEQPTSPIQNVSPPLKFSDADLQYLVSRPSDSSVVENGHESTVEVDMIPQSPNSEILVPDIDDQYELYRPSLASTISLDDAMVVKESRISSTADVSFVDEIGSDLNLRRQIPIAQNICYSGWVMMKLINKKDTSWFCVLKDKTLSFRHNDTETEPLDLSYPCGRISFIGRDITTDLEHNDKGSLILVVQGSQKVQHLKLLVDKEVCDTWILLIAKSCATCNDAIDFFSNLERAGPLFIKQGTTGDWRKAWLFMKEKLLIHVFENEENILEHDIRKILSIKSQVTEKTQWCQTVSSTSKFGPFLVATEGSSLHIQADSDLVTQCWKEALDTELNKHSDRLDLQRLTNKDVPHLVEKCINFISTFGLLEKGIHRLSGTASKVRQLMLDFQKDAAAVEVRCEDYTVHDAASALRKFLRSLDEPLFTKKLKPEFIKICHLPESDMHQKTDGYERLMGVMESEFKINYATLRKLFGHLKEVTDNCGVNSMTVSNISAIFGPSLFSVDSDFGETFASYGNTQYEMQVVGDLISNYYQIFHVSMKEVDDKVIFGKIAAHEPKKSQAGSLLIPVHMFEYDNQAFNIQDNKTAEDVCNFAIDHHKLLPENGPYALFEVVRGGKLERMVFPEEKLIDIAINRWQGWSDIDKSSNYLILKKDYVRRRIESVTPYPFASDVSFADMGSKSFKKVAFQCIKGEVCAYKNAKCTSLLKKWPVESLLWFFGVEPKRDANSSRSLTFMEKNLAPSGKYLGMCMCFKDESDMYRWLASVLLVQRAL